MEEENFEQQEAELEQPSTAEGLGKRASGASSFARYTASGIQGAKDKFAAKKQDAIQNDGKDTNPSNPALGFSDNQIGNTSDLKQKQKNDMDEKNDSVSKDNKDTESNQKKSNIDNEMPGARKNQNNENGANNKDDSSKTDKKLKDNNSKNPNDHKKPGKVDEKVKNLNPISKAKDKVINKLNPFKNKEEDNKKNDKKEGVAEAAGDLAKQGLKTLWTMTPVYVKFIVIGTLFVPIIIVAAIMIIFGITTGTAIGGAYCGSPSYNVNGTDATAFICTMGSPFGPEATEGREYEVYSTTGKRVPFKTDSGEMSSSFHEGIDINGFTDSSKSNYTVYAVADGTIVSAGWDGGYGNSVLIKHGDSFYTRYGHFASIQSGIKKGVEVKKGDPIGVEGTTGNSTGNHLHFELLDSNMKMLSANPFFGYSDEGYEECLKPNGNITNLKCDISESNETKGARYIGQAEFKQLCAKTGNYTKGMGNSCCNNPGASNADQTELVKYINKFEGSGGYCDDGETQYKSYYNSGDRLTIGHGVTTDYLDELTSVGQCIDVKTVDNAQLKAIDAKRQSLITPAFEKAGVTLTPYQDAAMVSMAYNGCANYFTKIAEAAKSGNYSAIWDAMKGCHNPGTEYEAGLKKRRKSEFALFVTGDYEYAKQVFDSTSLSDYNNYDSDNVIGRKATGTASVCSNRNSTGSAIVDLALKEYDAWVAIETSSEPEAAKRRNFCKTITKYMKACGLSSANEYCAGFVSYLLKETGVYETMGIPSYTCQADDFSYGTGSTTHKAGGSYIPQPGDIIVFDWSGKRKYHDHVGIVQKVEGQRVYTIEGNRNGHHAKYCGYGEMISTSYDLSNRYILEYVTYGGGVNAKS